MARTKPGSAPEHAPELGPCLLWAGTRLKKRGGYGTFYDDDQKLKRAHRVSWEIATETVLSADEHVLHRCDNPPCVRFEHLRLGDQSDNMGDMRSKGRGRFRTRQGQDHYLAVLTDEAVLDARRRYAAGEEIRDITAGHPSPGSLKKAIYGETWKHVEMPDYSGRSRRRGEKPKLCPQRHEYTPENTGYVNTGRGYRCRYCKQCRKDKAAARRRAATS